ncbi:MAG: TIGR02530 family flagellar biosynthesis protein [Gaiella sp.]
MSIDPVTGRVGSVDRPGQGSRPAGRSSGPAFGEALDRALKPTAEPLRFSAHALQRLERRAIDVDGQVGERLAAGVARAAAKGARDSLVLVDDTAFVVSVRNRTVITAVDQQHMKEQVFTNIDSAVIA